MTPTFPEIHDEKLMTMESNRKFFKSRQWQSLENIMGKKCVKMGERQSQANYPGPMPWQATPKK